MDYLNQVFEVEKETFSIDTSTSHTQTHTHSQTEGTCQSLCATTTVVTPSIASPVNISHGRIRIVSRIWHSAFISLQLKVRTRYCIRAENGYISTQNHSKHEKEAMTLFPFFDGKSKLKLNLNETTEWTWISVPLRCCCFWTWRGWKWANAIKYTVRFTSFPERMAGKWHLR